MVAVEEEEAERNTQGSNSNSNTDQSILLRKDMNEPNETAESTVVEKQEDTFYTKAVAVAAAAEGQ